MLGFSRLAQGALVLISVCLAPLTLRAQIVVCNEDGNTVTLIDPNTLQIIGSIIVGGGPSAVALSADGSRAYTSNTNDGTVSVINMTTRTVTATITVGNDPNSIVITPNGLKVYVANSDDGTVSVINTGTNLVTSTITLPITAPDLFTPTPQYLAVAPDGSRVYVANEDGVNAYSINTTTDVPTAFNIGIQSESVGITPNGAKAYFGGHLATNTALGKVQVVNIPGNTTGALLSVPASPHAVAVSPDGLKAYTTDEDFGTVSVISTASDTVLTQISGFSEPARLAFSQDGTILYVTDTGDCVKDADPRCGHTNAVVRVQTASNAVLSPDVPVGDDPEGIVFSPVIPLVPVPTPTLSEWGMILLSVLLAGFGALKLRKFGASPRPASS